MESPVQVGKREIYIRGCKCIPILHKRISETGTAKDLVEDQSERETVFSYVLPVQDIFFFFERQRDRERKHEQGGADGEEILSKLPTEWGVPRGLDPRTPKL